MRASGKSRSPCLKRRDGPFCAAIQSLPATADFVNVNTRGGAGLGVEVVKGFGGGGGGEGCECEMKGATGCC